MTSSKTIRIGVQLQPQHAPDYQLIRDALLRAEDAGVDAAFNWDHFYPLYPDKDGQLDGAHFECWTMLGAWAEQTSRIQLGALVSATGYRNPDLVADMARTVDHISGGRLILGVGAGWFAKDYEEYGYEFGTAGSRIGLLGENLDRIAARLPKLDPPPTRQIPVLIGGGGIRKTLRQVAKHANIWHSFESMASYRVKSAALVEHCAVVGRDPADIEHSAPWPKPEDGQSAEERADQLAAAGVRLFTVATGGPDYDFEELSAAIAWRDAHG